VTDAEAAARAAWDWARGSIPAPSRGRRRWASILVQLAAAIGVATALALGGAPRLAAATLAAGTALAAIALLSPDRLHPRMMELLRRIGRSVGTLTTWLLLTPFYFLVFTPFGLLTRRGRRDPLTRRWDRAARTYWLDRTEEPKRVEHYERQF
jgi:fatty acid desaturase